MRTNFPPAWHVAAAALTLTSAASGSAVLAAGNSCLWARLPLDQRQALITAYVDHDQDGIPESAKALYATVAGLIRKANGSVPDRADPLSDPVFHAYADYFLGRALEARASSAIRQ